VTAELTESAASRPKVFGIGLNKTGTSSLHEALTVLGYTSLHFAGPERAALIRRAVAERKPLLHYLDPRYDAFSDTPISNYFYLADVQYPGSKFILTVRDLNDWLDSRRRHVEKNQRRKAAGHYEGKFLSVNLEAWEAEYRYHDGAVRSYFADRPRDLLVLDVTEGPGWEPLCEFLGRPVPAEPFPWSNKFRPGFRTGRRLSGPKMSDRS
jgi:Sulfotransferase domain